MKPKNNILLFKALGEETKYRIIKLLITGEYCACEIPSLIGRTQSNTSMNLVKLRDWGIVQSRRKGKMVIYSIKEKLVFDIFRVLGYKAVKPNEKRQKSVNRR